MKARVAKLHSHRDRLRLGIIGGGQLGRMLIRHGLDFNIYPLVLDPDPTCPSRYVAYELVTGSLTDYETVNRFARMSDIVTVEIESVNVDALKAAEAEGGKVYPQPHILYMIQDKGLQKQFFQQHKIPTAPFVLVESQKHLMSLSNQLPAVLKTRQLGYDGRGVMKLRTQSDLKKAFDVPCVLEQLVAIEKEISVLLARNPAGQLAIYPPVEQVFHPQKNILQYLISPATLTQEQARQAEQIARQIARATGIIGLLAVEMFVTKTGELLVNELAPRPHNSGHHTIEGNETSQFEQLLRAVMNLPLGDTSLVRPTVMLNLLGSPGYQGVPVYHGLEKALAIPGVHVHLYGKQETKPFRKMGHITITATTLAEAQAKAKKVQKLVKVTT